MDSVRDFEDILELFGRHDVRYLVIGGLAFIFHAKPRYTKDIDLWVDSDAANVRRANLALAEFGSPHLLDAERPGEILQLGVPPNRIDLLLDPGGASGLRFSDAWERRIESRYGSASANWIDLDGLIEIKSGIDHPRHQEDARILRQVRDRR
ncbi:MAG: hypothetical protein ACREI7_01955 [Myxococcota bacterium]